MSRRDAVAAASHGARHAGRRLQATLGPGRAGLLPADEEAFVYGSSGRDKEPGPAGAAGSVAPSGEVSDDPAGTPGGGRAVPVLRWRLGLKVALLVGIVAVLCAAWFWWQVSAGRAEVLPLSGATPPESSAPAGLASEGTEAAGSGSKPPQPVHAGPAVLHVAGAVARPGIVEVSPGSRVHDAIAAAGGGTPGADLDRLNLAAVVVDGQKIYVPLEGEPLPAGSAGAASEEDGGSAAGGAGSPSMAGKTNLNSAGIDELGALPKVGPVLAQRIVDWRKEHGPFTSIEELDAVDGVGPKMLETLLPLVSVE